MEIILLLLLSIVLFIKAKDKRFAYWKVIIAILLPFLVKQGSYFIGRFISSQILLCGYDLFRWVLVTILSCISCIVIYKTITHSKDSVLHIWAKDFRIWNVLSCISFVLGLAYSGIHDVLTFFFLIDMVKLLYRAPFLPEELITDRFINLGLRGLSIGRDVAEAVIILLILLPAMIRKSKTEQKNEE